MEEVVDRKRVVVLVPLPFEGHLNPTLQLGSLLHSKGFSVTVIHTLFNSPNPSTHPHFRFLPIPDSTSPLDPKDLAPSILSLNTNSEAPLRELLGHMMTEDREQGEICCIIYDGFMYFVDSVARHFNLPTMVFRTTSAATVLAYFVYPQLQDRGLVPLPDCMLEDPIPGLHPLIYKDLPIHEMEDPKLYLELVSNVRDIRSSSAIIQNTVACLEESLLAQTEQQHGVPVFSVGPLHSFAKQNRSSLIDEDSSCIKWLDEQPKNSVIYVSIGSMATINENELAEIAWGLVNSKQPFLWVIRPGSIAGSEQLPRGVEEATKGRGCIVKWAPQREVLAHPAVGGFWSHCGWNSTIESISQGVPMICKPFFGDQMINASYLSHVWRVGLRLENGFQRGEIEGAVRMLMVDKEGSVLRMRSMDLKDKVQNSIKQGASSYNSLCNLVEFIMQL